MSAPIEAMLVAVQRRFEGYAVLVYKGQAFFAIGDHVIGFEAGDVHRQRFLEAGAERKDLESSGIGVGRTVPIHEPRKSTGGVKRFGAGALEQMEGIGQQALGAQLLHLLGQHAFHGGLRADRHERRCANVAVRGVDDAGAAVSGAVAA